MTGRIFAGVGGWTFEPWRGVFYPEGLKQKDELAYASRNLTAIEINGTYYSTFKPENWRRWREETPDGFVFTVKGSRFVTNRRELATAGESIERFLGQGLDELGGRLGPVLWQLPHTKKFDADDLAKFFALLPRTLGGRPLRHAVEPRHDSFLSPAFAQLLRAHDIACVYAKHGHYPEIADLTSDFVYARLQTGSDEVETAYPSAELDAWAGRIRTWADGGSPGDLPLVDPERPAPETPRDVFVFVIHEGKIRAPAAAMALIERTRG